MSSAVFKSLHQKARPSTRSSESPSKDTSEQSELPTLWKYVAELEKAKGKSCTRREQLVQAIRKASDVIAVLLGEDSVEYRAAHAKSKQRSKIAEERRSELHKSSLKTGRSGSATAAYHKAEGILHRQECHHNTWKGSHTSPDLITKRLFLW